MFQQNRHALHVMTFTLASAWCHKHRRAQFSKNYICRIYPRSGLSLKPLFLGCGVKDSDYRGNISVILTNVSRWNVDIKNGDRIPQIIFFKKEISKSRNFKIRIHTEQKILAQLV